ncbi:MAG: nitrate transporter [Thiomicrospira sp.]|nr:MAG: nitrate transporter [Thiomicrospira sp.]
MKNVNIGFIPLTDSAPLIIAKEEGFFEKQGLNVSLQKEVSWSNVRDKLIFGEVDAAHMLAPMLMATTLGIGGLKKHLVTGYSFGLNGNAIGVSNALFDEMKQYDTNVLLNPKGSAQVLKKIIQARSTNQEEPLRFAVVFPFSMHHYLLRHWLKSAGVEADREVQIVVVPPSSVVKALEEKLIDGYCVGEPWSTHAVKCEKGVTLITGYEIWNNAPEKVLGVTKQWADENKTTHQKLILALYQASEWIDQVGHKEQLIKYLAQPEYVGAPEASLRNSIDGEIYHPDAQFCRKVPNFSVPFKYLANFPWQSHAQWILQQMKSAQQIKGDIDIQKTAATIYLTDLYREALVTEGVTLPTANNKEEGVHAQPWFMEGVELGEDCFI